MSDWFATRLIGEAALLAAGAVVLGYLVTRLWPRGLAPQLFGILASVAFLGGLAYLGSTGATLAIVLLMAIAALMAVTGML